MEKCLQKRAACLQHRTGTKNRPLAPVHCRPRVSPHAAVSRPCSATSLRKSGTRVQHLNSLATRAADVETNQAGTATAERPSEDINGSEPLSPGLNGHNGHDNGSARSAIGSNLPPQTSLLADEPSTSGSEATHGQEGSQQHRSGRGPRFSGQASRREFENRRSGQTSSSSSENRSEDRYVYPSGGPYARNYGRPRDRLEEEYRTNKGLGRPFPKDRRARPVPKEDITFKVGDTVVGSVCWAGTIGWKVEVEGHRNLIGFCPNNQLPYLLRDTFFCDLEGLALPRKGLVREFEVVAIPADMEYHGRGPLLSCWGPDNRLNWRRVKQIINLHEQNFETVTVTMRGSNPGGLLAVYDGIPLFVPFSYIPRTDPNAFRTQEFLKEHYIGKDVELALVEANPAKRRLVGSISQAQFNKAMKVLEVGAAVWGTVRRIESYGAFIGVEGTNISGLLHITNLSKAHVDDIFDALELNERVRVMVIKMEDNATRISFSTAELEKEPGDFLFNKEKVFEGADEMAQAYRERLAQVQVNGDEDSFMSGADYSRSRDRNSSNEDLEW